MLNAHADQPTYGFLGFSKAVKRLNLQSLMYFHFHELLTGILIVQEPQGNPKNESRECLSGLQPDYVVGCGSYVIISSIKLSLLLTVSYEF